MDRKIEKVLILGITLFLGHLVSAAEDDKCPSSPYLLGIPAGYDHDRYAPLESERLYNGGGFISSVDSYDDDNSDGIGDYSAQPVWVSYHLKSYISPRGSNYAPSFERPKKWYRMSLFDEERKHYKTNKALDDSYRGIGNTWNRGHLAQRADANRLGEEYGCNTHVFANAVPQRASLNQGIWLGLENTISSLANQYGELWVVTGPIFYDNNEPLYVGENDKKEIPVRVPDAVFKVVFIEQEYGVQVLSFIYPNRYDEIPENFISGRCTVDETYDHLPYIVSLYEVEQATKLTFFSNDTSLLPVKKLKAEGIPPIEGQYKVGYCL